MAADQYTLHVDHRDDFTAWSLHRRVDDHAAEEMLTGVASRPRERVVKTERRSLARHIAVDVIDYFLDLEETDAPATLMVLDADTRGMLRLNGGVYSNVTVPLPVDYPEWEPWQAHGSQICTDILADRVARVTLPHMAAATDGSFNRGKFAGGGCGWIREDGAHGSFAIRCGSVLDTEVFAVHALLRASKKIRLTISVDSQPAIHLMTKAETFPHSASKRLISAVTEIREMLAATGSRLIWVRGHNGHPLNEGADRLAVVARRHELGVDGDVTREIVGRIVEETIAAHRSTTELTAA
jgi:ribonuclease HI